MGGKRKNFRKECKYEWISWMASIWITLMLWNCIIYIYIICQIFWNQQWKIICVRRFCSKFHINKIEDFIKCYYIVVIEISVFLQFFFFFKITLYILLNEFQLRLLFYIRSVFELLKVLQCFLELRINLWLEH